MLHRVLATESNSFQSALLRFLHINSQTNYCKPHKVGNRITKKNSAGIPHTVLLRIEAIGFPTFGLLLYFLGGYKVILHRQAPVAPQSQEEPYSRYQKPPC